MIFTLYDLFACFTSLWMTLLIDKFSIGILVLTTVEGLLSMAVEGLDQKQPVRMVSCNKFVRISN